MLLPFKCDNVKSFQDGFTFSMVPEKRMRELEYSILKKGWQGSRIGFFNFHCICRQMLRRKRLL